MTRNDGGMRLTSEETWRRETATRREFLAWRGFLPVVIAAVFMLVMASSGTAAEHPKSDHPKPEKPKTDHPTEHPKPQKPKSDHPTEHPE
jgi:hypothetical protein